MSAGVYIYVAGCETAPRVGRSLESRWDRLNMLVSMMIGTVPIGLILIDHKHCG